MRGFAKAFVAGNLTRDPEVRATPNGSQVVNFSLAVNRTFKGADGTQQEQVSYIECVAWAKAGETIAQYTQKGSPLLVTGRLEQRSWEDKTTGQKRSRTEVIVEDFTFLGSGGGGSSVGGASRSSSSSSRASKKEDDFVPDDLPEDEAINLDDIPF